MEKVYKKAFCVIGKPGSTEDGEGFVARLWADANSHFGEVEALAARDENGGLLGFWGAMTDMNFTFAPWTDNFTVGRYLAGVECDTDAFPPKGWKKWIVPGFEALKVKVESENTFAETLKYMEENGLTLGGAVHDFTDPSTGENYMFFPLSLDNSKREMIREVKNRTESFAPCGFHCENCMFSEWCGNCLSACNMCSYATLSDDNICENVRCTREKGIAACMDCAEIDTCRKGFFSDSFGFFAKASSKFEKKYGKDTYLKAMNSRTDEEKKFCENLSADPNDTEATKEAIAAIIALLEKYL